VQAVGEEASAGLKPGDRVYTTKTRTGSYAEFTLAEEKDVHRVPDHISFLEAAAVPTPFFTAHRALFAKLNIKSGKTILIHGATGSVGIPAMQMAKAQGLRVIGTAGSDAGLELISAYADKVVKHGDASVVQRVLDANDGNGVDYIVEMLANVNLGIDLKMLQRGGSVCIVGSRGDVSVTPRDLMRVEGTICAVFLPYASDEENATTAAYIEEGLASHKLHPIVGKVFKGLEEAPSAHEEVIAHSAGSKGKIVIELA
jgi:NADPH2:quinone reductase